MFVSEPASQESTGCQRSASEKWKKKCYTSHPSRFSHRSLSYPALIPVRLRAASSLKPGLLTVCESTCPRRQNPAISTWAPSRPRLLTSPSCSLSTSMLESWSIAQGTPSSQQCRELNRNKPFCPLVPRTALASAFQLTKYSVVNSTVPFLCSHPPQNSKLLLQHPASGNNRYRSTKSSAAAH